MSDSDKLLAFPITEELGYRENINSKKLNEMIRSIDESVMRSLIRGTKLSEDMARLSLGMYASNLALSTHNASNLSFPPPLNTIPNATNATNVAFASAFEYVSSSNNDNGNSINKTAGIVTMDWNTKTSKIPVYEGKVSPNIEILVDGIKRAYDDPIYNILDGDPSSFWAEYATAGPHNIELRLPPSINKTFNYLEVIPFPIFGINITGVVYTDLQSREQVIFPKNVNSFYSEWGPLVFHLAPREFNNTIKIYFDVKPNINTMGFTSIDVANIDYTPNANVVYMKFENINPPAGQTQVVISDVWLDFYADGETKNGYNSFISEAKIVSSKTATDGIVLSAITHNSFLNAGGSIVDLGTEGTKKCLYLRLVLNEVGLTTPVVRGSRIRFVYGSKL